VSAEDDVRIVREAFDAAYHIKECAEHPEHLAIAEESARRAGPALARLAEAERGRDEARNDRGKLWQLIGEERERIEAAEARLARLEEAARRPHLNDHRGVAARVSLEHAITECSLCATLAATEERAE